MACNSCNSCNPCNTCPQPCPSTCLGTITQADLGELVYIAGLDVNLCKKYSPVVDAVGFLDCEGEPVPPGSEIVTCAAFDESLCETFAAYPITTPVAEGTLLVGADCATHTMPAFQAPLTVLDTSTVDLTLAANVLSAVVEVSADAGNIIEIHADGLYANVCDGIDLLPAGAAITAGTVLVGDDCLTHAMPAFQAPLTFNDTDCIALDLTGTVVTAEPIISEDAGNVLECVGDGLYVPDLCTQLADVGGLVVPAAPGDIFVTVECLPRTLPVNGGITVLDTTSVDLTLTGLGVLSADVEISSVPDNLLELRPDGLAVRCTAVTACVPSTTITAVDTSCLNLDVVEAPDNTFTITGNPIISPLVGNQLSCVGTGLYVPAAGPATEVTCEAIQDAFTPSNDVVAPGELLLGADCFTYAAPSYNPLDTDTINTTIGVDINGNPVFSADVILADTYPGLPAGCNGLVAGVDGLSAPAEYPSEYFVGEGALDVYNAPTTALQAFASPIFTLNVTNPSDCREAVLHLTVSTPQIAWTGDAGGEKVAVSLVRHINFPSLVASETIQNFTFRSVDTTGDIFPGIPVTTGLVIQPGEAGTLGVSIEFDMLIGTFANLNIDRFILRAWLKTT